MTTGDALNRWVVNFPPQCPGAVPLICFPYAGGAASAFFAWSAPLAPDLDVLAIQYPGRHDRRADRMPADLHAMAEDIAGALTRQVVERPCLFYGHSMGAIVAYEVARIISVRHGAEPARLIVSGRRAPSRRCVEDVHLRDEQAVLAEIRALGGRSARALDHPELRQLFLPVIRSDYELIEKYEHRPAARLGCPITVLTGASDSRVSTADAMAWAVETGAGTEVLVRPGGHFFIESDQAFILDLLRRRSAEVGAGSAGPG